MTSVEACARRAVRLQYQHQYNYVKRLGRRKVGKVARRVEECARRAIISGTRKAYTNTLGVKDLHARDALRTPSMAYEEREAQRECLQLRNKLVVVDYDNSDTLYLEAIRKCLDEALDDARQYLDTHEAIDPVEVHRYHRRIAGYAQDVELVEQGSDAEHSAVLDNAYIFSGRRVNWRAFKQVFGF
ncbi:hypothetical protein FA95DRAFT_1613601 [Auriscalpium vulgare]|uniref:Uncharacterized protein n=1 Tax=Auriscalpium vulgare TaxID=40419 RepID=A0ACB8R1Z2_9AGAM|nr:hypothetical protein FA95DRAFT_1613601 [Auriscalpium vulgare]